jgi:rhodanese-related sulfurtransferase
MAVPLPGIPRVEPDALKRRMNAGIHALLIDVRSHGSFLGEHVAGARHLPTAVITEGHHGLPRDRDLVLY